MAKRHYDQYKKSDGDFMPKKLAMQCQNTIPRLAWVCDRVQGNKWKSVLDVACKDGYLALTLAKTGCSAVGIDIARDAIKEAQVRAKEFGLDTGFEAVSIEDYITDKHFDLVCLLEVLDRVNNPDEVLEKCMGLGDNLILSVPVYYGRFGWDDKKRNKDRLRMYKEEELGALCSKYGYIEELVIVDSAFIVHLTKLKEEKKK